MSIPHGGACRSGFRFSSAVAIAVFLAFLCCAFVPPAYSQQSAGPQPAPLPPPVKAPVDQPYPGVIGLVVSARDVTHRVLDVRETVPVRPGEVTLLYPEWIPGTHSPTGPISEFAGLEVTANGKRIPWVRDRVNVYAFHVDVPAGVRTLHVKFE